MRRADRLFQIVQLLRRRRTVTTAAQLARTLEISERTVYRDIRDLIAAGTPIDAEAGVGYRLGPDYDLPPLMFDREEIQALVLGARIVRQVGDPALARASESILNKVAAVLPKELEPLLAETRLFVPAMIDRSRSSDVLAIGARRRSRGGGCSSPMKTERARRRADGAAAGVLFWGRTWTLAAWCEMRTGFRNFRLDRVNGAVTLGDVFEEEAGRTLRDLLAEIGPAAVKLLDA